ncbi:MAG TPA: penicillin-binding protein 2 [Candidatus Acidoferrales bacterium]|nr:penicillin-binding protein 2 [Candidatus Acidoferrales bacterium]
MASATGAERRVARLPAQPTRWKLVVFIAGLALALAALVSRLTVVQIVEGPLYANKARENQIRRIPVAAPRGHIYDRNGVVLVRSRPSFVCGLVPSEVHDITMTLRAISKIVNVPVDVLQHRLLHHRGIDYDNFDEVATYEPYGPVILASDLSTAQMARLAEAQTHLPGVDLEAQPVRDYPYGGLGSHLFGYVGQITEDEYAARKNQGYTPNDVVGKDGLEAAYDNVLRGIPGGDQIEVDAQGQLVRRLAPVESVPGDSLVLSIDWRLQELAESALRTHIDDVAKLRKRSISGAVVVLDPYSGAVLAMASYPNFNPNDFATGIKESTYSRYLNDPLKPLYNRAIGAATATGSTFKMVTGSGAISSGVIAPDQVLYDSGYWNCYGALFRDIAAGGLGTTDFVRALAASSDGYFYQVGYRMGHARLRYYALQYGLGHTLGIDIPGEYPGNWPTEQWMQETFGPQYHLEPSDVCQLAIGQGAMQATPLQMADIVATVVNGGTLYRPRLVWRIRNAAGVTVRSFRPDVIRHVNVTQIALRQVRAGMAEVTDPIGTAYGLAIPGIPFAGKTGTVETDGGDGPNTTWFVAYAPIDHPKIAMAVFMERSGGYGADTAAPVAHDIIASYLANTVASPSPTPR